MKIFGKDISFSAGKATSKELADLKIRVADQGEQLRQAAAL